MIRSFLIVLAMLVGTTTCAQEGLPKFVQNLSYEDYATWAAWQNRQAKLRVVEESEDSIEEPFVYSVRTTSSINGGITAALNRMNKTNRTKRSSTTRSTATNNVSTWRNAKAETMPHRYVNPAYRPPGSVTIHNPYARFARPVTNRPPNWDNIFLPCKSGTLTVTEALEEARGPMSAERLFSQVMSEWLGK
jgi:hypothetical protein